MHYTSFFLGILFILSGLNGATQQACGANVLVNPSFESPLQPSINNNNIVGPSFNGWVAQNNGQINIVRVNPASPTYFLGPRLAHEGVQYLDIVDANDYPVQAFVLTESSQVKFSGWFSSRAPGPYINWTASIDILDATTTVVATSNTMDFTIATDRNTWFYLENSTGVILPAGSYRYRATVGDYGNFDDAILCIVPERLLPVTLLSFTGNRNNSTDELQWKTATEKNTSHFEIEYSSDGVKFNKAGSVRAIGNSTAIQSYQFSNPSTTAIIWYRLRIVDLDGSIAYSPTIKISDATLNRFASISTHPVPFIDRLNIGITSNKDLPATIVLVNASGMEVARQVTKLKGGMNYHILQNLGRLQKGLYMLRVETPEGVITEKVAK